MQRSYPLPAGYFIEIRFTCPMLDSIPIFFQHHLHFILPPTTLWQISPLAAFQDSDTNGKLFWVLWKYGERWVSAQSAEPFYPIPFPQTPFTEGQSHKNQACGRETTIHLSFTGETDIHCCRQKNISIKLIISLSPNARDTRTPFF